MFDRIKAWLKASPAPVVEQLTPDVTPRPPLKIAHTAVVGALVPPIKAPDPMSRAPVEIYKPYAYTQNNPGMAMDWAAPTASLADWAAQSLFHEGQGFFGFPYLAELLQRSEYRHACEIWAEHVVRKWIRLTGGTTENRKAVEDEMARLRVRDVVEAWCFMDQAYGRGQIFLDFNDADKPNELKTPLRIVDNKISKSRPLTAIKAIEPVWSAPNVYETSNPLRQDFYKPTKWIVYGKEVHASRLLTITSRPVSDMLKPSYAFSGLSLVQMMKPYVDNWLRTREAVSDMINTYSILNLKTDMSSVLAGGDCSDVLRRADLANQTRDNRGMWVTDMGSEELVNIAVPLSGLDGLQAQSQEQLASVARIPLSIYLQITPTGLNATNDGETRNFYADVHAYQEKNVAPALLAIFDAVQLSLFGKIDPTLKYEFLPLWEMSDKDKSDIRKADADADNAYVTNGIISAEEVRERLSHDETSIYYGVDLTDPPPENETEDTADEQDADPEAAKDG